MFSLAAGWKKLGQPVPDSNFTPDSNSGRLQQTQTYMPGFLLASSVPQKAGSVPLARVMRYCSGVKRFLPLGVGKHQPGQFLRRGQFAVGADDANANQRHGCFSPGFGRLRRGRARGPRRARATARQKKHQRQ